MRDKPALRLRGAGVKGLHSHMERLLPSAAHTVTLPSFSAECPAAHRVIVVDGMAMIRKLYPVDLEWLVGGQFQALWGLVADFVGAFGAHGFRLVVFFDGGVDDAKLSEWQSRRRNELAKVERVVGSLARGERPPSTNSNWMPPPNISKAMGGAFAEQGCDVYYTAGEADRDMAAYCVSHGCAAVLAKDSDFFVLPVPAYLNLDTLALHSHPPTVACYRREAVERALGLPSPLLPLLGSIVGNDFVPTHQLSRLHSALLPGRHASGAPLIEAAAKHVAAAAAAARWTGPTPTTPLLWNALDFGGRLSAEGRALVERSLSQYEVGGRFDELPASLLERSSGASAEMLRRFRRGALDSAVFTSATRYATWRGPSIDDPSAPPNVLAARPIRAEIYAACVRPPPPAHPTGGAEAWGGGLFAEFVACGDAGGTSAAAPAPAEEAKGAAGVEVAAGAEAAAAGAEAATPRTAAEPSAAAAAATTSAEPAGLCVWEHVIYTGQADPGSAEMVPVPPQLVSCETMWSMPPAGRCSCLLRLMGRASRRDHLVAQLGPTAVMAMGPLALTLLTVRFLRRRGLAPRTLSCVLLCQGLVMAWLARTRQRLPSELRHMQASTASLQIAHAATLFLRTAEDVRVLNSACGQPLSLHGPWEWFDGVVFDGMLRAALSSGDNVDWAAMLRGDASLLRLFGQLRPLALGIEMEPHALGRSASLGVAAEDETAQPEPAEVMASAASRVRDAAALWREATQPAKGRAA